MRFAPGTILGTKKEKATKTENGRYRAVTLTGADKIARWIRRELWRDRARTRASQGRALKLDARVKQIYKYIFPFTVHAATNIFRINDDPIVLITFFRAVHTHTHRAAIVPLEESAAAGEGGGRTRLWRNERSFEIVRCPAYDGPAAVDRSEKN